MSPAMLPSRREGHTVVFVTDLHAGKATYGSGTHFLTAAQHRMCGIDLDWLASFSDVVAYGGDLVDWRAGAPEDAEFKAFLAARAYPQKQLVTSGNHDLAGYNAPNNWRTGNSWAASLGVAKYGHRPAGENAGDGVQVVALSQETMKFSEWLSPDRAAADPRPEVRPGRGFQLTDNAANPFDVSTSLGYLRSRLETGRPTWVLMHYPLDQHYRNPMDATTAAKLTDIITSYGNVIGVLSGHRHANPFTDAGHVREVVVNGNSRRVVTAGINGPAAGGKMAQVPSENYPWDSPFLATVVTYSPGRVIVRWRDLIRRRWVQVNGEVHTKTLNVSCSVPITLTP